MKVAIFDFDGTLLCGNSYHEFIRLVLEKNWTRSPILLSWLALRKLRLVSALSLKNRVLNVLHGARREEVSALGRKLYEERLRARLRPAGLREIELRRQEGCKLILITRAFDFIAEAFAQDNNFPLWRATKVAFRDDVYCLGRIEGAELYGVEKSAAAQILTSNIDVDWARSWGYGDEASDLPLLSLVGNPVLIRTHKPLPQNIPRRVQVVSWER